MPVTPGDVTGARIRWRERSAVRHYDGDPEPSYREDVDEEDGPFKLGAEIGRGTDDDDTPIFSVRMKGSFTKPDAQVRIDVEVVFKIDSGEEVDQAFIQKHAMPYVFGYVRGGFTDACRSVGLPGWMIPMVDLAADIQYEDA
ncbi:hypothetical protein SEA_WRIGLEY_46 [Gordonia phage Wrigley]|nr:hypothetical protein SEA_WRIGLEY_46 [Gordonia phage Wrigley]